MKPTTKKLKPIYAEVPAETHKQLAKLVKKLGLPKTKIVAFAIEFLFNNQNK